MNLQEVYEPVEYIRKKQIHVIKQCEKLTNHHIDKKGKCKRRFLCDVCIKRCKW